MSDREALAAAIQYIEERWTQRDVLVALAACRERLAQLPEKCEHGFDRPHSFGFDPTYGDDNPDDPACPGKVYPAELVERIAVALYRRYPLEPVSMNRDAAVAVLDALNGEMP